MNIDYSKMWTPVWLSQYSAAGHVIITGIIIRVAGSVTSILNLTSVTRDCPCRHQGDTALHSDAHWLEWGTPKINPFITYWIVNGNSLRKTCKRKPKLSNSSVTSGNIATGCSRNW